MARLRRPSGLALLLLVGCGWTGSPQAGGGDGGDGGGSETPPAVEVVRARRGALPLRERLTGTVRASGQVAIFPQVAGRIVEVLVDEGDEVEGGAPLVRLDAESAKADLAQAEASLEVARAEVARAEANLQALEARLARAEDLAQDDLVSVEALDDQRAQAQQARAAVKQAEAQVQAAEATAEGQRVLLRQLVVRAPLTGHVGLRDAEVGMQVDGQTRLFTMGRLDRVRVEVPVTQDMIGKLRPGQPVALHVEERSAPIEAELSRISPFLEEGSYSAEAEIDVDNEGGHLRPGMFVTVDVHYGEGPDATLVPKSAVYEHPGTGAVGVYSAPAYAPETEPFGPPGGPDDASPPPLSEPTPTRFHPIELLAEGHDAAGVSGVEEGSYVVVVGQHLLSDREADGKPPPARVRLASWERIVALQGLQRQDLLRQFLAKQQRIARERRAAADSPD